MGFLKKLKPKNVNLDLNKLNAKSIVYFCKTQVIDKRIALSKNIDWNQEIADMMEKPYPFYFIAKSNLEYDVLPGDKFGPFIIQNKLAELPESSKSEQCINHFINSLR